MSRILITDLEKLSLEIASLHRAGLPVSEGLKKLSVGMSPKRFGRLAGQVADGLEAGNSLAVSLQKCDPAPSEDFIALVECAESAADFQQAIDIIVEHARRHRIHQSTMTTTLVYPLILVLFAVGILYFIANWIIPKFDDVFTSMGAELPFLTQLIMDISRFLQGVPGMLLLAIVALPIFGFLFMALFREAVFRGLTRLPLYRHIIGTSDTVILARFLALMLEKNVETSRILAVASTAVWDPLTKKQIMEMKSRAEQGLPMSDALPVFMPATAAWIFRQGEQRGQLIESCSSIAQLCEDRFDLINRRMVVSLEPLIIALITFLLAFMAIGLYIPIFAIPKLIGGV